METETKSVDPHSHKDSASDSEAELDDMTELDDKHE